MNTFAVNVNGQIFEIHPQDEKDQVIYHVFQNNIELFAMGLNEDAAWEATNNTNPGLVRKIGDIIEQHDA